MIIVTIFIPFLIIEIGYQIANVYKVYEIDKKKKDVDIDRYDPYFGWVGIPGNKGLLHGEISTFYFENNSSGFRDIEHDTSSNKPAIVFLGASFP
jgi:hypothetical protein